LIKATREDFACYREVNTYMSRAVLRFRRPGSVFWIHDYHFLTLGMELRRLGVDQSIGFFLHTPWPSNSIVTTLPNHREIVQAMLAYDLIGFQTDEDLRNFVDYLTEELELNVIEDLVSTDRGDVRLAAFPIGIDADEFSAAAVRAESCSEAVRLRSSVQGKKLVIGVDRVDYSKGMVDRLLGFDRLLATEPSFRRSVSMLQIAVPSRERIDVYNALQSELATTVGAVNGRHGDVDWTPIRYINRAFPQSILAGLYRSANVGLVTPFHDGMNLVAKEYVAAQNPSDPGALVLSRFAGAAKELDAAQLVNPHDTDDIARKLAVALRMSREERCDRWNAMMKKLTANSIHSWFSNFLATLNTVPVRITARLPYQPRALEHGVERR
jgi:trehalose 6-phosphate synthase